MKKKILAFGVALSVMLGMAGCSTAHTVNHNLSKDANEFNIYRRITVTNARTDTVMLQAEGYMALGNNSSNELVVTIKTGDDQYYKDYIYLNDWTCYVNDGHRVDKHFVPGLIINGNLLERSPDGSGGLVVGTKTSYVKGKYMKEAAIKKYRSVVRTELDKRVKEAFR